MKICMSCGSPVPATDAECQRCGAQLDGRARRLTGTIFANKYRIEDWLGSGGMCDVYRARHVVIGKQVAIKVLRPEFAVDPKIAQRFEQEALAASRVRHPNAIDVTDFGLANGNIPFIVMELVEGKTLGEMLRDDGPFQIERAANIIRQVCGALEVAHSVGVIHRDIKPDNILMTGYEGGDWVEVADFGVAKIQEDVNRRAALTGANFIIGTPRYMSPEQCDERPVDARSDIYSLGVVVYEMLSGETPFEGNSTRLLIAHAAEPPAPLSLKLTDVSPEIEAVVMRALEKDPERRQQSAAEFGRDFLRAAGLLQESPEDEDREDALSRVSIPLGSVRSSAQEPIVELDDEATLVRRPSATEPRSVSRAGTIPDLSDYDPYNTIPEVSASGRQKVPVPVTGPLQGVEPAPGIISRDTDERDPMEFTSAAASSKREIPYQPTGRSSRRVKLAALAVALLLVAALAAYLLSSRGSIPETAGEQAQTQPPATPAPTLNTKSAPAAATGNPAPATDDGVESTPHSVGAVPDAEADVPVQEVTPKLSQAEIAALQKQVTVTLHRWLGAEESQNLNEHLSYYSPALDRYYLRQGVSRDFVRKDREAAMKIYDSMKFQLDNIDVKLLNPSGTRAVATFEKKWDFKGKRNQIGIVVERVWLQKANNRWRITGERDLRVNYVRDY